MKKSIFLVAIFAIASLFTLQAQELPQQIISFDFESGSYEGWTVWNKNTNEIVDARQSMNSKHAVKVTSAMHFGIDLKADKAAYSVTADINPVWGGAISTARVQMYDKSLARFVAITEIELPREKGFKPVEMKFKTKTAGHYRIAFIPNGQSGACFILDNVKLTRTK